MVDEQHEGMDEQQYEEDEGDENYGQEMDMDGMANEEDEEDIDGEDPGLDEEEDDD